METRKRHSTGDRNLTIARTARAATSRLAAVALTGLLLAGCAVYPAPVPVAPAGVYVEPAPVVVAPAAHAWWGWHWHRR